MGAPALVASPWHCWHLSWNTRSASHQRDEVPLAPSPPDPSEWPGDPSPASAPSAGAGSVPGSVSPQPGPESAAQHAISAVAACRAVAQRKSELIIRLLSDKERTS